MFGVHGFITSGCVAQVKVSLNQVEHIVLVGWQEVVLTEVMFRKDFQKHCRIQA